MEKGQYDVLNLLRRAGESLDEAVESQKVHYSIGLEANTKEHDRYQFDKVARQIVDALDYLSKCAENAYSMSPSKKVGKHKIAEDEHFLSALCQLYYRYTGDAPRGDSPNSAGRIVNKTAIDFLKLTYSAFKLNPTLEALKRGVKELGTEIYHQTKPLNYIPES